jgi:hypothetical protein
MSKKLEIKSVTENEITIGIKELCDVLNISDKLTELAEARATMIVNFGDNGWYKKGLVNPKDSLSTMIIKVLKTITGKAVKDEKSESHKTKKEFPDLRDLGFKITKDGSTEFQFRMSQLKLVLMPADTFAIEIWHEGKLINGQRLDIESVLDVEKFIKYFEPIER